MECGPGVGEFATANEVSLKGEMESTAVAGKDACASFPRSADPLRGCPERIFGRSAASSRQQCSRGLRERVLLRLAHVAHLAKNFALPLRRNAHTRVFAAGFVVGTLTPKPIPIGPDE